MSSALLRIKTLKGCPINININPCSCAAGFIASELPLES